MEEGFRTVGTKHFLNPSSGQGLGRRADKGILGNTALSILSGEDSTIEHQELKEIVGKTILSGEGMWVNIRKKSLKMQNPVWGRNVGEYQEKES